AISAAIAKPPIVPVYNADGSYTDAFKYLNPNQAGFDGIPNPVQIANELRNYTHTQRTIINSYAKVTLAKDLEVNTSLGGTMSFSRNDFFHPSTMQGFLQPPPVVPYGNSSTNDLYGWLSETTLSYQRNFAENHRLNFLA